MEILGIIGIIVLIAIVYVAGGILGWGLKGIGEIFGFLNKGWGSCIMVIFYIFAFFIILAALASYNCTKKDKRASPRGGSLVTGASARGWSQSS